LAGRDAHEAVNNYREPLKDAVGCVTNPVLLFSEHGGYRVGEEYSLALMEGDPVQLSGTARIAISVIQYFQVIQDEREDYGPFRVTTTAYYYTVEDENGHEIIAYHWHPKAPNSKTVHPHVHLQYGAKVKRQELAGTHLPTGRVAVEDFLRLMIEVFGVAPLKKNWSVILGRTKKQFDLYKSW
jgi:hypothetical protein